MSDAIRELMLKQIRSRMEKAGMFYPDVWERVEQSESRVLREIVESDFEGEVRALALVGGGSRA